MPVGKPLSIVAFLLATFMKIIHDANATTDLNVMQEVDGIRVYYTLMLHSLLPRLKKVCDLKRLHVDGVSFIEDYTMMQSIYSHVEGGFESLFGSFQYHLLDGTQLARRITEIALDAIRNPDMQVFEEKLVWKLSPEEFAVKKAFL